MRVAFVAPELGASTHECVHAALRRCGHEPVDGTPDLVVAQWFDWGITALRLPRGKPVVRWWVGCDVRRLGRGTARTLSRAARLNWAGDASLAAELAAHGVAAGVLPILPHWEPQPLPRSERRTVLAYCPQGSEALYCWEDILAVASACPDIQFRVFGRRADGALANLTCVFPWTPHGQMRDEYAQARAVLRLVKHDGMSLSVLEALGFARHVVWSKPFHACREAQTVEQAVAALRAAVEADPNLEGVEAMRSLRAETDARMAACIADAGRAPAPGILALARLAFCTAAWRWFWSGLSHRCRRWLLRGR